MKNIDKMSYQELLDLEKLISIVKKDFYDLGELEIVQEHLCTSAITENSNFWCSRISKEYYDIFSGELIAEVYIDASFPSLKNTLDKNKIPYENYMRLSHIEEVWSQYKNQSKLVKKRKTLK